MHMTNVRLSRQSLRSSVMQLRSYSRKFCHQWWLKNNLWNINKFYWTSIGQVIMVWLRVRLAFYPFGQPLSQFHTKKVRKRIVPSSMQEGNPLTTSKQWQLIFLVHFASSKAKHLSSFKCELENYQAGDRVLGPAVSELSLHHSWVIDRNA